MIIKRLISIYGERIIAALLIIMTAIAAIIIANGAYKVYRANSVLDEGLSATEQALAEQRKVDIALSSMGDERIVEVDANFQKEAEYEKSLDGAYADAAATGQAILSVFIDGEEYRYAVYNGMTSKNLWRGVARASESNRPGEKGNCMIFGHRDSAFRCLKDIEIGDKVVITTSHNKYFYKVERTKVCHPDDLIMTDSYDDATLTLVTCHPFIYSGPSPERFLVICKLVLEKTIE
ncbi:MAG: class D sortase [Oscillospiraceae bacterium]